MIPGYVFDPDKKVIWRERFNLIGWVSPGDNLEKRTPTLNLSLPAARFTAEQLREFAQFLDDIAEKAA